MREVIVALLENYFEPTALAAELGISLRTLYSMNEKGEGPPRTVIGTRRVLYSREAVAKWLQSREERKRGGRNA
jgi:predicted DNA-binding transcriptional regulator AlpA